MTVSPAQLPPPSSPAPAPGFWEQLGAQVLRGASAIGTGLTTAWEAIDADVRNDIGNAPLLGATSLGPRRRPIRALASDGHRPLLFVHGMGGHPGNFLPMRGWMGLRGRRQSYSLGRPVGGDLTEFSRLFARQVEQILDVNGIPDGQVDIVAHSMGGIIARLAMLDVSIVGRVRTLVTLGTPHQGTQAARWGGTACCQELRPDSATMHALAGQLPWRGPARLVSFWSPADPFMQPAQTAFVPGADNRELEGFSHTDYLLRRRGWRAVLDALAEG